MKLIRYSFTHLALLLAALFLTSTAMAYTPEEGLAAPGDSKVCSFGHGLKRWGYASARISFPCGLNQTAPAITLTGGYTNIKEQMYWLANHLTSHGYIVIAITPYNVLGEPTVWKHAHLAGIEELLDQNDAWWSPIRDRVDLKQLGVMGYSNGGGGALLAAGELGYGIKTVTALAPNIESEEPKYYNIGAQTQIVGGSRDLVSRPSAVGSYYESLPTGISRNLSMLRYMTHLDWVGIGLSKTPKNRAKILITAWLNLKMRDKKAFEDWFIGDNHDDHLAEDWFTRFDYRP